MPQRPSAASEKVHLRWALLLVDPGEAGDVVDLVEDRQRQYLPDSGDRLQSLEAVEIVAPDTAQHCEEAWGRRPGALGA